MPVNIDSNAVKDAEEQLQNPNCDMFHLQQQQVKNTVHLEKNGLKPLCKWQVGVCYGKPKESF